MSDVAGYLRGVLDRHARFEESLLTEMRLMNHGYSVELDFDLTLGADGRTRTDLDTRSEVLTVRLDGVSSIQFVGGLTAEMVAHPEAINWGLSEVAIVRILDGDPETSIQVAWDWERSLTVSFHSASVCEPAG